MNSISGIGIGEFEQAARHMVVVGDDENALVALAWIQLAVSFGIADRIDRVMADIDAAFEKSSAGLVSSCGSGACRRGVDARDQQPFAGALLQQFHRLVDALVASGQNDDGVGLGLRRRLQRRHRIGK
jgi:hypothetical protein